jgi:protein SCO1
MKYLRYFIYLSILISTTIACSESINLKPQGSIGTFSLKSHHDKAFSEQQLNDKVWVANFIFTSCKTVCPKLTAQMQWVQDQIKDQHKGLTFISFSVDPYNDTPQVLSNYVKRYELKDDNWFFLTGDIKSVKTLVVENLKQAMGKDPNAPENILHGSHFILGKGSKIYEYYKSNKAGLNQLVKGIHSLH